MKSVFLISFIEQLAETCASEGLHVAARKPRRDSDPVHERTAFHFLLLLRESTFSYAETMRSLTVTLSSLLPHWLLQIIQK